jgi:hypothetical protein
LLLEGFDNAELVNLITYDEAALKSRIQDGWCSEWSLSKEDSEAFQAFPEGPSGTG